MFHTVEVGLEAPYRGSFPMGAQLLVVHAEGEGDMAQPCTGRLTPARYLRSELLDLIRRVGTKHRTWAGNMRKWMLPWLTRRLTHTHRFRTWRVQRPVPIPAAHPVDPLRHVLDPVTCLKLVFLVPVTPYLELQGRYHVYWRDRGSGPGGWHLIQDDHVRARPMGDLVLVVAEVEGFQWHCAAGPGVFRSVGRSVVR